MFQMVFALVRRDIRRQVEWARAETKRQVQEATLTAGFAVGGALAALATVVIGLMALYTWAAVRYGPLVGFALVGAATALVAVVLFWLAFMRSGRKPAERPEMLSTDPATLKAAVKQDLAHESTALLESLKQSSFGPAVTAGENALKTSEQAVRFATDHIRSGSRPSLLATLAIAAVLGLVLGRRVAPRQPH